MHQSSLDKMKAFKNKYLRGREEEPLKILDLGSCDVNGTYKNIFDSTSWEYVGIDLNSGKNVDIVLSDPYNWKEIESSSIDIIISGQAFEHIEYFWLTMLEVARVLKLGGLCCIIVPSGGYEHKYPVDCWRFYPDGLRALARFAQLDVLDVSNQLETHGYKDGSDEWKDSLLVCRKPIACISPETNNDDAIKRSFPSHNIFNPDQTSDITDIKFNPLRYYRSLTIIPRYLSNITSWHQHIPFAFMLMQMLKPNVFVELGTHKGDSYFAFCQAVDMLRLNTKCYAIDTWEGDNQAGCYDISVYNELKAYNDLYYGAISVLIKSTFDQATEHFSDGSIDLLHIDGIHTYDAVKHDFDIWLPKMSQNGIILFHDISVRAQDFGVWRLWEELKIRYLNFEFKHGHGLGVLSVGNILPESLKELFHTSQDVRAAITGLFHLLGYSVHLSHAINIQGNRMEEKDRQLEEKDKLIQTFINSWSWKVTMPLRGMRRLFIHGKNKI